jgi:hypothetical protein
MYENFIVELEWRHLRPGGNSGFFVWSDALTSKGVPFTRAVENQILDGPGGDGYTTQGDVFAIHGATMTPGNPGKWKGRSYPTENRSKPSPEWNHYRIECNNGAIALAVNGKVVTTAKDVSQRKGYLCLESEGGLINFRNIRIKELPPTENLDPKFIAQPDRGLKSLYTGINLEGWKVSEHAKEAWQPKDWTLHFDPSNLPANADSTLWTADRYHAFEMIIDVRSDATSRLAGKFFEPIELNPKPDPASAKPTNVPKDKRAWKRVLIHANSRELEVIREGVPNLIVKRHFPGVVIDPTEFLGLRADGPADFANIYIRKDAVGVGAR